MRPFEIGFLIIGVCLVMSGVALARIGQAPAITQGVVIQDSCASIYDKAYRWTVEAEQKKGSTTDEDLVNVGIARAYSESYMACREKGR